MIFNNSEDLSRLLNKSRDEILSSYVWKSEWLKLNCYANAIFALHQKVFSKYRHCHVGEDVVIVACGPSARHAPVIHGAKYLAVNRALFDQRYKFDYFFRLCPTTVLIFFERSSKILLNSGNDLHRILGKRGGERKAFGEEKIDPDRMEEDNQTSKSGKHRVIKRRRTKEAKVRERR